MSCVSHLLVGGRGRGERGGAEMGVVFKVTMGHVRAERVGERGREGGKKREHVIGIN